MLITILYTVKMGFLNHLYFMSSPDSLIFYELPAVRKASESGIDSLIFYELAAVREASAVKWDSLIFYELVREARIHLYFMSSPHLLHAPRRAHKI